MEDIAGAAASIAFAAYLYSTDHEVWQCFLPVILWFSIGSTVVRSLENLIFGTPNLVPHPNALRASKLEAAAAAANADKNKPKLTIIFASQTGTAELYAQNLGREAKKLGFRAVVEDTADYNTELLCEESLVLFLVSTYGEGEPTDTSKEFYTWLMSDERAHDMQDLSGMNYCVFGLGDSQYKHFCQMGLEFDQRLAELNAKRLHPLGKGDSDMNMEEDFDTWKAEMWIKASAMFGLETKDEFADAPEQQLKLKYHPPPQQQPSPFPVTSSSLPPTQKLPCWGIITRNDELLHNPSEPRSTKHIEIDCGHTSLATYEAGDHLGILPANSDAVVDEYMRLLRVNEKAESGTISLVPSNGQSQRNYLPNKVYPRQSLQWHYDLQGVPKKSVLRAFTHFTADPKEQEEFRSLLRLGDESTNKYHKVVAQARTVAGFLKMFPSTDVPLDLFLELMPRIQPRWYSIASDSLVHGKTVHLCLAVTSGGLCSEYLKDMPVGSKVPCFIRKSTFHLPMRDKSRPTVMIGPGTGVAPLVGFIHRRSAWKASNHTLGSCMFYFGCRKKSEDYIYSDLMESALGNGIVSDLRVAFSRDQQQKVYVQHLVKEDGEKIMKLIDAGANIYICGDAKNMARQVEEELRQILIQHGGMQPDAAEERLNKMEKTQRYLKDVWTSH